MGFYYFTVLRYGSNIPISDDFDAVLDFLYNFNELSSFYDKIALLLLQHNEHRIVLTRLVVLGEYYLLNTINFKTLILIGNVGLVGILITAFLSHNKRSLVWFTPVVFILFEPQFFGAIFFAMGSIQNFYVLLFAFISLYFLSSNKFILAAIFATMSTFTGGSGILCFITGVLALLLQKRFKLLAVWLVIMSINIFVYLYGYTQPTALTDLPAAHPSATAIYFIMLLGNIFYIPSKMDTLEVFSPVLYLPLAMGVLLLAFFIYLTIRKYYLKNTALYSFLVFILLSEVLTAAGRSSLGLNNALSTRYIIMSVLLVAFSYIALIEIVDEKSIKKYFYMGLAAAISFNCLAFYINHSKIAYLHKSVKQGILYFQKHTYHNLGHNLGLVYPNQKKARDILLRSIDKGYYRIPDFR
ncbi:MAG: hypothetical protein H7843_02040 [Nitrospirota bacterium]